MTEKQFNEYKKISEEIKPIKEFLKFCGDKYAHWAGSQYNFALTIKKPLRNGNDIYELPWVLQDRIIDVIEQYVDEKQKELDEI